jgi:hypothetical protein
MTTTETLPKMLTPAQVAAALPRGDGGQVSVRTVQRMARRRLIPGAVYVGRCLLFQRAAVLAWIEGGASADVIHLNARRA